MMPIFLDTRGRATLGIGLCGRCSQKFPLGELMPDPNVPSLFVCREDRDNLDPYRLPSRPADRTKLENPRPDVSIAERATVYWWVGNFFGITEIRPCNPWQATTRYERGDSIVSVSVNSDTTTLPQPWFVCIVPGISGATPPSPWPNIPGQLVGIFNYLVDDTGASVHLANVLTSDLVVPDVFGRPGPPEAIVSDLTNGDGTVGWLCMGGPYQSRTVI